MKFPSLKYSNKQTTRDKQVVLYSRKKQLPTVFYFFSRLKQEFFVINKDFKSENDERAFLCIDKQLQNMNELKSYVRRKNSKLFRLTQVFFLDRHYFV